MDRRLRTYGLTYTMTNWNKVDNGLPSAATMSNRSNYGHAMKIGAVGEFLFRLFYVLNLPPESHLRAEQELSQGNYTLFKEKQQQPQAAIHTKTKSIPKVG